MQPVMVARWGIDPATKANQITREQKRELVQLMKHWRVSIDAYTGGYNLQIAFCTAQAFANNL